MKTTLFLMLIIFGASSASSQDDASKDEEAKAEVPKTETASIASRRSTNQSIRRARNIIIRFNSNGHVINAFTWESGKFIGNASANGHEFPAEFRHNSGPGPGNRRASSAEDSPHCHLTTSI